MSDDLERYVLSRPPTADRPLQGMTVLVVEDSRFASEAIRLLCLRSGARIRRADSLAAAHRHLAVYRPSIIIVDMGLPDGSGADLIHELASAQPRVPVLLGISGDMDGEALAFEAGADGFLPKPLESLAQFQQAVLMHLPAGEGPTGPRKLPTGNVHPDMLAYQDDLTHIAEVIRKQISADADLTFGAVVREELTGRVKVTVIAADFKAVVLEEEGEIPQGPSLPKAPRRRTKLDEDQVDVPAFLRKRREE